MLLSICIPTKDRPSLIKETIDSIVSSKVNKNNYEIVISDNSDNDETFDIVKSYVENGINIVYYKNPEKGFYNSINVLTLANGDFLKLQNDYTKFRDGSFEEFYYFIESIKDDKPTVFFGNGSLKIKGQKKEVSSLDSFVYYTSFINTWSSAFSIWRQDLLITNHNKASVDVMFPHTSVLFSLKNDSFVLDNSDYFENISVDKKGGYNIFYNFCYLYIGMLRVLLSENKIKIKTFNKVKYDMLIRFIAPWYYKTIETEQGYTFDNSNSDRNIMNEYGLFGLGLVKLMSRLNLIKVKILRG